MQKDDIVRIARLARIELTEDEIETFANDIGGILEYVKEIQEITGDVPPEKVVGAIYNVMRKDEAPHESGMYTEAILNEVPDRHGQYIRVKKILGDT
jgi:aspartyl-tRNA(Asn)/glutamyl-tRNA(Gln) amidotransferase subunit C